MAADRVGGVVTLIAVARGASAIVVSDTVSTTATAIALGILEATDRHRRVGRARLIRPGDLLAVDGDIGSVLVQPAPTETPALRERKNREPA